MDHEELGPALSADPRPPAGRRRRPVARNPPPTDPSATEVRADITSYDSDPVHDPLRCMLAPARLAGHGGARGGDGEREGLGAQIFRSESRATADPHSTTAYGPVRGSRSTRSGCGPTP
ncbi:MULTISPECIES: hypothetical protein [unclassified Streptomyces]|uniref:hypothetical protein n=1 Tax=unclassified Streptomyces TaxID=2593676 RepID=UPI0004BE1AAE|nr:MULTISPECIES: hypothetical protein [unclassified Streptomyces]